MKRGESAQERGSWFDVQNTTGGEGENRRGKRGQEGEDPAASFHNEGRPTWCFSVFMKGGKKKVRENEMQAERGV